MSKSNFQPTQRSQESSKDVSFTPTSHNSFNSSTGGCKYTSILFSSEVGPRTNNDSMKEDLFMHIHGGRLHGIKMIGHVLWVLLIFPYGLNPSDANPSLTLRGSDENSMYLESNDFQASESIRCLSNPSFTRPLACHFIWLAVLGDINSHCNLGFKGNHRKIFAGFFFFFFGGSISTLLTFRLITFPSWMVTIWTNFKIDILLPI